MNKQNTGWREAKKEIAGIKQKTKTAVDPNFSALTILTQLQFIGHQALEKGYLEEHLDSSLTYYDQDSSQAPPMTRKELNGPL